jgi:catechol 2,3-dioxygenase-like lactoylglutathione lyase family enzyme
MGIDAVRVVSNPVSDQERARDFYVEKLGFELIGDDDSVPGIRWVNVAPREASTALTLVREAVIRDPAGNRLVLQQS